MDRRTTKEHLAIVEGHVARGESTLARQREVIAGMQARGQDSTEAMRLLGDFVQMQAEHVAHRNRLLDALELMTPE